MMENRGTNFLNNVLAYILGCLKYYILTITHYSYGVHYMMIATLNFLLKIYKFQALKKVVKKLFRQLIQFSIIKYQFFSH